MNVHLISTSMRPASVSRELVGCLNHRLERLAGVTPAVTDLRNLPPVLCDGRRLDEYPRSYGELATALAAADAVIIAVPIYQYAPSGASKNLLEIVGSALAEKPVGIVSSAGSSRSLLATTPLLTPLLFDIGCIVLPRTLQTARGESLEDSRVDVFLEGLLSFARGARGERQQSIAVAK